MKILLLILTFTLSLFAAKLSITSNDGYKLYGWLEKPKDVKESLGVIVFAHQFGADHTIWDDLASKFNDKGYATLSVDLRGHGKSIMQKNKENKVTIDLRVDKIKQALNKSYKDVGFDNIPKDLSAWIDLLEEDDEINIDELYLFGSSLGAGTLIPLLNSYEVKALVAISCGRLEALAEMSDMALSTSMSKMLFIASDNDPLGDSSRTIDYAKKAIFGTALVVSSDGHGNTILPLVEDYIFSFIKNTK